VKVVKVDDSNTILYCITSNNLLYKLELRQSENNEIDISSMVVYPSDEEMNSLHNLDQTEMKTKKNEDLSEYYGKIGILLKIKPLY
jgi:hypothetical protein